MTDRPKRQSPLAAGSDAKQDNDTAKTTATQPAAQVGWWEVWSTNPRTGRLDLHGVFRDRQHALRIAARYRACKLFARVCEADDDPHRDERRGTA